VLNSETLSLSGGVHQSFKRRSARKKKTCDKRTTKIMMVMTIIIIIIIISFSKSNENKEAHEFRDHEVTSIRHSSQQY
jgi:preprotein translocase subunit SecG